MPPAFIGTFDKYPPSFNRDPAFIGDPAFIRILYKMANTGTYRQSGKLRLIPVLLIFFSPRTVVYGKCQKLWPTQAR